MQRVQRDSRGLGSGSAAVTKPYDLQARNLEEEHDINLVGVLSILSNVRPGSHIHCRSEAGWVERTTVATGTDEVLPLLAPERAAYLLPPRVGAPLLPAKVVRRFDAHAEPAAQLARLPHHAISGPDRESALS